MGGHWNLAGGRREREMLRKKDAHKQGGKRSSGVRSFKLDTAILTTLLWVLIRVVSTIVLAVTLPAQGFTEGVVTLELIWWTVSTH